jgi:hypothetical protein
MERRQPGKTEVLLAAVTTLVSAAAMTWYMIPQQERYWIRLRMLRSLHHASGRLARRVGHAGMGDELAGLDFQRYGLAYRLSRMRDTLGKRLEDMKP